MKIDPFLFALCLLLTIILGCQLASAQEASYYSGGGVACPSPYHYTGMTAAIKDRATFPCGAVVDVTTYNRRLGKTYHAQLTVTDRGPFIKGRVIDVYKDAAGMLGLIGPGHLPVTIRRLR